MSGISSQLFNTIPKKDYFHFFGKEAQSPKTLMPKRVIDFLNFQKNDVALAADQPLSSVRYDNKMPEDLRERITEWGIAINLVAGFLNDVNKTIMWFQIPNPLLGNISPRDLIRIGRFKRLLRFIQTALEENKRS